MGAMSRRKGARFEREIAKLMSILFPGAKRGIGQSRWGGEVDDVSGTPWWVECKRGNASSATAALRQATLARKDSGKAPLAVIRRNGERVVASMYLEDFLAMVVEYTIVDPTQREEVLSRLRASIVEVEGVTASGKKKKKAKETHA